MELKRTHPRAWGYARIPGDLAATKSCLQNCRAKAESNGCDWVGASEDLRSGWLQRPGYREMIRRIKAGEVDSIYIPRMHHISSSERHLLAFFKLLTKHKVKLVTTEYSIRSRVRNYRFSKKVEEYAARHDLPVPW